MQRVKEIGELYQSEFAKLLHAPLDKPVAASTPLQHQSSKYAEISSSIPTSTMKSDATEWLTSFNSEGIQKPEQSERLSIFQKAFRLLSYDYVGMLKLLLILSFMCTLDIHYYSL
jgi:hypothetical protein